MTTIPAYSALSIFWKTNAEAITMTASVRKNSAPVLRNGNFIRSSLIMISVPPVVEPALNTHPMDTAIRALPHREARSGSTVTAPTGVSRFVNKEVIAVQ